jgi:hypothetical protein
VFLIFIYVKFKKEAIKIHPTHFKKKKNTKKTTIVTTGKIKGRKDSETTGEDAGQFDKVAR